LPVWWHGGGYTSGSGFDYDAQRLASRGAMAACALLTSPAARGLVQRVAMRSGSCLLNWPAGGLLPGTPAQRPYASAADNRAVSRAAAKALHCASVSCLRRLSTSRLLRQSINFSNVLAYGTTLLPTDPAVALRRGRFLHVPLLSGGTQAEENSFVAGAEAALPGTYTAATYPDLLGAAFGAAFRRPHRADLSAQRVPVTGRSVRVGHHRPWPRFDGSPNQTLQLTPEGEHPVDVAAEHHCDLWASIDG
jgi:carboxylesterase type B